MRQDIRLFINGKEVEFNKPPQIYFNYKITDSTNPSAVKNSFSKSLKIESTPNNNDIFSNIWNLESYYNGGNFNPYQKADFTIYLNGEIYEKGYVKLTNVETRNNLTEYTVNLFGGLGQFFWNLSYSDTEGNTQKKLSDLLFKDCNDLGFTINRDAVWDAWNTIMGNPNAVYTEDDADRPNNYLYDEKWLHINFAPCYEGTPDSIDASKVLINKNGLESAFEWTKTEDSKTYKDMNGYALGTANRDLTEWETFDLRSYLQRPVVNMRKIIEACGDPSNNGGYEVKLDEHFFNNENPYWSKAWMTLPRITEMELGKDEKEIISDAEITRYDERFYDIDFGTPTMSKYSNLNMNLKVKFTPDSPSTSQYLETYSEYNASPSPTLQPNRFPRNYRSSGGVTLQLLAMDSIGNIIGASKAYLLAGKNQIAGVDNVDAPLTQGFYNKNDVPDLNTSSFEHLEGKFVKNGNSYEFCDIWGNPMGINFNLASNIEFTRLVLKVKIPWSQNIAFAFYGGKFKYDDNLQDSYPMFENTYVYKKGNHTVNTVEGYLGKVMGQFSYEIEDMSVTRESYESFYSDTYVKKDILLNTDNSVCDYLLSFTKMFGLYFYQDPSEEASDTVLYPKGVIHIMDRNTFYNRSNVVDITDLIDRSKSLSIIPQIAESKYYSFNIEQNSSECNDSYKKTYGYDYGQQIVNTNYQFDASTKELYDNSVFKGGVMCWEKDKYYSCPIQNVPIYSWNGFSYNLFRNEGTDLDTTEIENKVRVIMNMPLNRLGLDFYDSFPKLQCHTEDNSASDGDHVLLFLDGKVDIDGTYGDFGYWITDDVEEMTALNNGNTTWIMTSEETDVDGNNIAYKTNELPKFTRDIIYGGLTGNITHSWDFNGSRVTYRPKTYNTEEMGIYHKVWKNYINDMYSVNSRKLTCYLAVLDKPNPEWLTRFYWFDNSIWRLNAITDWEVGGLGTTKMEFIKIQDLENYALDAIDYNPIMDFTFPQLTETSREGNTRFYSMENVATDLTGSVYVSDGGVWFFGDGAGSSFDIEYNDGTTETMQYVTIITPPNDSGYGTSSRVFHIPANTGNQSRVWNFNIVVYGASGEEYHRCKITQPGGAQPAPTVVRTVSYSTDNVTLSNTATSVNDGDSYTTVVTPDAGYELDSTCFEIRMGGIDITDDVLTDNGDGTFTVNISRVNANVSVSATATETEVYDYIFEAESLDGSATQGEDTGIRLFADEFPNWTIFSYVRNATNPNADTNATLYQIVVNASPWTGLRVDADNNTSLYPKTGTTPSPMLPRFLCGTDNYINPITGERTSSKPTIDSSEDMLPVCFSRDGDVFKYSIDGTIWTEIEGINTTQLARLKDCVLTVGFDYKRVSGQITTTKYRFLKTDYPCCVAIKYESEYPFSSLYEKYVTD